MIKKPVVKLIAQSVLNEEVAVDWIRNELGHTGFVMPERLFNDVTLAGLIVMCAGKRCYNSFSVDKNKNLTKVNDELAPHIEGILKSGHGSVLEHVSFTFAIEGVTRVLTGELNRHRAGTAISEASGRYIRFNDDIDYRLPECFELTEEEESYIAVGHKRYPQRFLLAKKKMASAEIFEGIFRIVAHHYEELEELWEEELLSNFALKKILTSAFRRIVPMGYCGGGVWTFNVRALRHIFTLRSSPHAEEEIREVVGLMFDIVKGIEPLLFCDMEKDINGVITRRYSA